MGYNSMKIEQERKRITGKTNIKKVNNKDL
jgi:hypothetical protein